MLFAATPRGTTGTTRWPVDAQTLRACTY
jgi:hypothetical protein